MTITKSFNIPTKTLELLLRMSYENDWMTPPPYAKDYFKILLDFNIIEKFEPTTHLYKLTKQGVSMLEQYKSLGHSTFHCI